MAEPADFVQAQCRQVARDLMLLTTPENLVQAAEVYRVLSEGIRRRAARMAQERER